MKQIMISLVILAAATYANASVSFKLLACQDENFKFDLFQTTDADKALGELASRSAEGSLKMECERKHDSDSFQGGADLMHTVWTCRHTEDFSGAIKEVNYSVNIATGGIAGMTLAKYAVIPVPALPDFYPHAVFGTMYCQHVR